MGSPGDGTVTGRVLGSATLEFPDSSPDSDGPEVRAGVREGPAEGSQDEERTGAYGVGAGWGVGVARVGGKRFPLIAKWTEGCFSSWHLKVPCMTDSLEFHKGR